MKILIIGSGFIGFEIANKLVEDGHQILVFSRTRKPSLQVRQITGDIFAPQSLDEAINWRPQVIVNSAWITKHDNYLTHSSNIEYSRFAIELARIADHFEVEHLVTLGSCAEYGEQTSPVLAGVTELKPLHLYSEQKVIALEAIKNLLAESQTRMTWARIFQPYGPRQDKNRLIPHLISQIKAGNRVKMRNSSAILDWISSRDVALAISWIINNDLPQELDIGTSIGHTNLEVLEVLKNLLGKSLVKVDVANDTNSLSPVSVMDKRSPLMHSGWTPIDTLVTGLDWTLKYA